ncbi:two-component response regulator-like APRR5 isoform X1 [Tripterygium wilfordii]|uniref:Two-component response regulator-like APRR5 isoform X1 n=1 Tax=Tripterygium wilfordii TaxID=458696 RepID=A0A7J7CEU3_TRIWF|nr:two-component response regulator-like APRR9 [Tripterygium wilfordii]KAF5732455.1 two-component response regulator-like APRR5 isoform X1 [Tripterygium wilfordii]
MGDVVLSSDKGKSENETESSKQRKKREEEEEKDAGGSPVVKWERLLPRTVMRVLLVEADDSTRQIIAALLRKCSYRVAAISDGLKAWEILKGRPHNIDLILTEVELPSISGYALLTLIMEHEICKNIPVIMMSSQDSINTVYKCMLRGAADYLVKPIRRNELRNLWQHVWRRQHATVDRNGELEESVGQEKVEAISDNDAASNHSSGNMARDQRKEYIEKGSDAQSSCTKPDLEAESSHKEHMQDFSLPMWGKLLLNDIKMRNDKANTQIGQKFPKHGSEAEGSMAIACKEVNMAVGKDIELESHMQDANLAGEAGDNADALANSSGEAIDFMGAFTCYISSSNNANGKSDSSPHLDLFLTRSQPSGPENQINEERRILRQSTASAFTRYASRALNSSHLESASSPTQQEGMRTNSGKRSFNITTGYNSDTLNLSTQRSIISPDLTLCTRRNFISLPTCQSKHSEIGTSCPQQILFPVPIPVRGARLNIACRCGSALSPLFCSTSGSSPMVSPGSANQQEPTCQGNPFHNPNFENNSTERLCNSLGQTANNYTSLTLHKQDQKLYSLEDRGCISPATDHIASSNFCNGSLSRLNSMGYQIACGSNSNVEQVAVTRPAVESKLEEAETFANNEKSPRSIQREAALTKFRLKRKDRCFEKKVRYETRKKLAEQRPRVKGQFVRQALSVTTPAETENHHDE